MMSMFKVTVIVLDRILKLEYFDDENIGYFIDDVYIGSSYKMWETLMQMSGEDLCMMDKLMTGFNVLSKILTDTARNVLVDVE